MKIQCLTVNCNVIIFYFNVLVITYVKYLNPIFILIPTADHTD